MTINPENWGSAERVYQGVGLTEGLKRDAKKVAKLERRAFSNLCQVALEEYIRARYLGPETNGSQRSTT